MEKTVPLSEKENINIDQLNTLLQQTIPRKNTTKNNEILKIALTIIPKVSFSLYNLIKSIILLGSL